MEEVVMPVVMLTLFIGLPAVALLVFLMLVRRMTGQIPTVDLRGLYFYLVSFVSLLLAFFALLNTTGQALELALSAYYPSEVVAPVVVAPPTPTVVMETPATPSTPEPTEAVELRATELQTIPSPKPAYSPSRWARQRVAQSAALVLVALPVWWLHWRRARRLAEEDGGLFPLRLYLYGMMAVGLIAMVVMAAQALGGGLQWVLRSIPTDDPIALRIFWKDMLSAGLNALVALALWWYHWRTVESLPPADEK